MSIRIGYSWVAAVIVITAAAILLLPRVSALAQDGPGPFTQAQVTAGREAYLGACAGCHGADLGGVEDAPPLTGQNFNIDWSASTIRNFYQFISTSMPTGAAGDLSTDTYYNISAYLLAANGAKPGTVPFNKDSDVKIGAIADGKTVAAVVNGSDDAHP